MGRVPIPEAPESIQGSDVGLSSTTTALQPSLLTHTLERLLFAHGFYLALPSLTTISAAPETGGILTTPLAGSSYRAQLDIGHQSW
jgi:hypothetical protein